LPPTALVRVPHTLKSFLTFAIFGVLLKEVINSLPKKLYTNESATARGVVTLPLSSIGDQEVLI